MRMALWGCVLVAACGDDPSGPRVRFGLPASGPPAPLSVPWPSDVYLTDADGTIVDGLIDWRLVGIDEPEPSAMLAQVGALDGFSLVGGAVFSIEGLGDEDAIDVATLSADPAPYALIDLETGSAMPCSAGWDGFAKAIVVLPEAPLQPGRSYAAALTSAIRTVQGKQLDVTSEFSRVRGGGGSSDAERLYRDAIAAARDHGLATDQLVAFTMFTTQTTHRGLRALRDRVAIGAYGAAPTLNTSSVPSPFHLARFGATAHAGWTATLDEWLGVPRRGMDGNDLPGAPAAPEPPSTGVGHDAIGAIVTATFVSPQFPRPFTKTAAYDDGTIAYDPSGAAVPFDATAQIPVSIVIPKGPAPVSGFPVVIFQHGLGGDRWAMLAVANELARARIATAAIEAPLHGLRSADQVDAASNGKGTYTGPDGFADGGNALALLEFNGNMRSSLRIRALYWQTIVDLVQLRRLLGDCDLSAIADEFGGTAPRLDGSRVAYIGMSLGGQMGTLFAAVEPRSSVNPFVLDVPPSLSAQMFSESATLNAQINLVAAAANVPSQSLDSGIHSAALQLVQVGVDAVDAVVFAPEASAEHDIWMIAAGQDAQIPRRSSEALARALGAAQVTPSLRTIPGLTAAASPLQPGASGRVVGYFELSPANHDHMLVRYTDLVYEPPFPRAEEPRFPKFPNKIHIRQPVLGMQRAIVAFLQSAWAGTPQISISDPSFVGLLPVADLDDDGYCDATERAAGTDPYVTSSVPTGPLPDCARDLGFAR